MGRELENIQHQLDASVSAAEALRIKKSTIGLGWDERQRLARQLKEIIRLTVERDRLADEEDRHSRQLDAQESERNATARLLRLEKRQQELWDEMSFWSRRFVTTLALAQAAAFTGIAAGLAQADDPHILGPYLALPMNAFAVGMISAGLMPLVLFARAWIEREYPVESANWLSPTAMAAQWGLAFLSAYSLLQGIMWLIGVADGLG